ncbi:hypothetical protein ACFPRL_09600 [Pseudoclavibacter helvolus]
MPWRSSAPASALRWSRSDADEPSSPLLWQQPRRFSSLEVLLCADVGEDHEPVRVDGIEGVRQVCLLEARVGTGQERPREGDELPFLH